MLRELHISNLAVIEDARIELKPGLNAFTGQTGAGKSLVLGAFEILLGLKSATNMVRPGAKEARVSGVFELEDPVVMQTVSTLSDQLLEPNEPLLVTRKFFPSGRSSVSINGLPATTTMLKAIGQQLVDIHGQHDHQFLLRPSNQLTILDNFANATELRQHFTELFNQLRDLRSRKQQLLTSQSLRTQQLELYEFQANEIDDIDPVDGEYLSLSDQHKKLTNASKLLADTSNINSALYESDSSIISRLEMMTHLLRELTDLDPSLEDIEDQVRTATINLQEASFDISRYIDRIDASPKAISTIESRLNQLNRLMHKYAQSSDMLSADPLQAVIDFRIQLAKQIAELENQDHDLSDIDMKISNFTEQLTSIAFKLSVARKEAAKNIKPLIESQLSDLGMSEARFDIQITTAASNDSNFTPTGLDTVEILIQTNPGQGFRPLRKIASGGELSRIMLAIKSILASSDRISVLVFDEIDANIGGRLGSVIGQKLRNLAHGIKPQPQTKSKRKPTKKKKPSKSSALKGQGDLRSQHQVLCITHLPQIAAFADRHLRIEKTIAGKGKTRKTSTTVMPLEGQPRIEELAEMISGRVMTSTTLKQAEELLDTAQT